MTLPNDPTTDVSSYPLIVYVHVPKTAGTTLKKFLTICTPRGHGDINVFAEVRTTLLDIARQSDWISGHLARDTLASGLSWLNRPIEYFSLVRHPIDQIISYLNFSLHRNHGPFRHSHYNEYDEWIDAEVASVDFSNLDAVMKFLLNNSDRYFNLQSRFLLGEDFELINDVEIKRRLETYTCIATEATINKIYRSFGFAKIPESADMIRENVAVRHLKTQVFDSPEMKDFLAQHHRHDLQLYQTVANMSWPAEWRDSFRPSLIGEDMFTSENFEEHAYLNSNPDVASAVDLDIVESGLAHFSQYGHREGRMKRQWIFVPNGRTG